MADNSTKNDDNSTQSSTTQGSATSGSEVATRDDSTSVLITDQGRTSIADVVVSKIAGIAAREINGVHDLGGGASRAVGAIRERIPGSSTNHGRGVTVEVGEKQAAIDLGLVADYGVAIADLAGGVRRNVINAVERMTGLQVVEVNITVHDIFLDEGTDDEPEAETTPRVA